MADYSLYAKKVSGLGFDILELPAVSLFEMGDKDLDKLAEVAKETGLEYTFSLGLPDKFDISAKDASVREAGIAFIKDALKKAKKLNAVMFGGVNYAAWNGKNEDGKEAHRERSIASLKQIMPLAEDLGISYCVEVVNRFEQFIINDHNEAVAFVHDVGSPNIKVELDTFHMNIEENSFAEAIKETGGLIGHMHIGENNRRPPGTGMMPWKDIFGALREIDYQGRIVMEPFVLFGGEVSHDVSLWREIMPNADLDHEAKKALNFVREQLSHL
jgi:D-psicose/D-tagatose/L-ribulose 3-epimerase